MEHLFPHFMFQILIISTLNFLELSHASICCVVSLPLISRTTLNSPYYTLVHFFATIGLDQLIFGGGKKREFSFDHQKRLCWR